MKNSLKLFFCSMILLGWSVNTTGQTSVALRSQWLDPTNLFTEKKPTAELNTTFSVGGKWSLNFYYAHDVENLTPIYLIGGANYTKESAVKDSLDLGAIAARVVPKFSRNLFLSYQYSETVRQLSWFQPIMTWNWNFVRQRSGIVHTITPEISGWLSFQRGDNYQDGCYVKAKYNCAKHLEKWILNGSFSSLAVDVFEKEQELFVFGQVLNLSSTYLPWKTTVEVVLNKPLITDGDDRLGFTAGIVKEF